MPAVPVAAPLPGFGPVTPQERITTLDILRGFAVFAILVVNWSTDASYDLEPWKGFTGAPDLITYWIVQFSLNDKALPIFSFLFGLGFAMQMLRAEARGAPFVGVYARRLLILFLIGATHDILTDRDVLWRYAIVGFVLLPVRKLNLNLVAVLALICVLFPFTRGVLIDRENRARLAAWSNARPEITLDVAVLETYVGEYQLESGRTVFVTREGNALSWQQGGGIRGRLFAESPTEFFRRSVNAQVSFVKDSAGTATGLVLHQGGQDTPGRKIERARRAIDDGDLRRASNQGPVDRTYATGTFGQVTSLRIREFRNAFSTSWTAYLGWLRYLAMFLLGLYAGRRRIFENVAIHRPFIRRVMWGGFALGVAGTTAFTTVLWPAGPFYSEFRPFTTTVLVGLVRQLGSPALGLAYVAALTLLLEREVWKRRLAPLAAVGRMALTNYLLHSVAFVLLFYSYGVGLGFYAKVGAFGGVMLALPVLALELVVSQWWLRRFRFGPAEWLWRSLTYGKRQLMRISQPLVGSRTG